MAELKAYWRLEVSRVDRPVALLLYHSGYPAADLSDGCLRGLAGFGGAIVVVSDRPCEGIECVSPQHLDLAAAIGQRLHRLQLEA